MLKVHTVLSKHGDNEKSQEVERGGHVELGRGVRYVRHLQGPGDGCLS